jgi:SRR1
MPHTLRKQRIHIRKRIQVANEDGWTHITTNITTALKKRPSSTPLTPAGTTTTATATTTTISTNNITGEKIPRRGPLITVGVRVGAAAEAHTPVNPSDGELLSKLYPAEAPARLTLDELKKEYERHRQRWKSSSTWKILERSLVPQSHDNRQVLGCSCRAINLDRVDNVICIGLGSLSGFGRGGWVDRRSVSLYQLAALDCILEILGA